MGPPAPYQLVLGSVYSSPQESFLKDIRSCTILLVPLSLLHITTRLLVLPALSSKHLKLAAEEEDGGAVTKPKSFLDRNDGPATVTWGLLRLLGLCGSFGLTVASAVTAESRTETLVELMVAITFLYLVVLSISSISIFPDPTSAHTRVMKLDIVLMLLALFGLYTVRDFFPMATWTMKSADKLTPVMWCRLGLLAFIAIFPPACTSPVFVPADPSSPSTPTIEQRASFFSQIFFLFLDPVIFGAWSKLSLSYDELPPLADCDSARVLRKDKMHILDPLDKSARNPYAGKKNTKIHIGWRLIRAFRRDVLLSSILCFVTSITESLPPLAVNRLLNYIETGGDGAVFKPWVWVIAVSCGPLLQGMLYNYNLYISTRFMVRCESIVTQTIFDHTLRGQFRQSPESTTTENGGKQQSAGGNMTGRITNLISSEINAITGFRTLIIDVAHAGLGVTLSTFALYIILGWSSFVGISFLLVTLPFPAWLTVVQHSTSTLFSAAADARIQRVTEAINSLRVTKMFGQEESVKGEVTKLRGIELALNRKSKLLSLLSGIASLVLPLLVMATSFASFTLLQHGVLSASKVFSAITAFGILSSAISTAFQLSGYIRANVSLQRLNTFLHDTELIDRYTPEGSGALTETGYIGFTNATFIWHKKKEGVEADRNFRLFPNDLIFAPGKVNLITGPTGSGKTSLLMALLGEMHLEKSSGSSFRLPRAGGVAYADQQSWLLNLTLRDNILLGSPFDEERYNKVIKACALERDFSQFNAGDQTEVGEKGLTLSGGQKARITLARAVYSFAQIILLDDVFSALDVHTSRWIIEKCFKSDLIKGRTVLLVTHHIAMASSIADFVVLLQDGKVKSQGSVTGTLETNPALWMEEEVEEADEADRIEGRLDENSAAKKADGKLVLAEEKAEGRVSLSAVKLFVLTLGGPVFWSIIFIGMLIGQLMNIGTTAWLGQWARQYDRMPSDEVPVSFYLGVYCGMITLSAVIMSVVFFVWQNGALRSGTKIHRLLLDSIFAATLRFLDSTPTGRILSRFSRDVDVIDGPFMEGTIQVLGSAIMLIMKLGAITIMVPIFSIFGLILAVAGGIIAELYIHAQLSTKREKSNKYSPVLSHLSDCVTGLVSVRAFGAQEYFRNEAIKRTDQYMRANVIFYNLNRWCNVRFDTVASIFSTALTTYLVYGPEKRDAASIGFTLAISVEFSSYILWFVRILNDWEVEGNSVERVEEYLKIDHEDSNSDKRVPPAYWPASGTVDIKNLSARYSQGGPVVLKNISLSIESGLRVGVVGRTGSGKSTLALALLRLIPTEGDVLIDGRSCNDTNLDALRSAITIIPQDPTLFSGTLRLNLDPFGKEDDATLNDALKASGLFKLQTVSADGATTPGGHNLTLDSKISPGGENLSMGQRQIVALARGLVRRSKVYIFDEATASVDYSTDEQIQNAIRSELSGATLLTVAHRLKTIMDYDKILVLGAGEVLEFDTPKDLLAKKNSHLSLLVDQSPDAEELRRIANGL